MATPLAQNVVDEMRRAAQGVKDRMAAGNFTKTWSLTGKNAIVEPGRDVIVRLMPRWDYANSLVVGEGGRRVPNPDYKGGKAFALAYEHWWDLEGGKTTREWCPRTIDPAAWCPVCEASSQLQRSTAKDDRDYGKRIRPSEVFIFNAVVGDPRRLGQDGLADVRILSCPGTVYTKVSDIMTGGENGFGARGDIMHPRDGYDLLFKRPAGGGSDRWDVRDSGVATPLYAGEQAAAFKGWVTRLVDLNAMLEKETKSAEDLFRAFYGRAPEPGEVKGAVAPAADTTTTQGNQADGDPDDAAGGAAPPTDPDDDFLPPANVKDKTAERLGTPSGRQQPPPLPAGPRAPRLPARGRR